jgi:hypothetical protein
MTWHYTCVMVSWDRLDVILRFDHIARRDSTQQNYFVELSCVGRCDRAFTRVCDMRPSLLAIYFIRTIRMWLSLWQNKVLYNMKAYIRQWTIQAPWSPACLDMNRPLFCISSQTTRQRCSTRVQDLDLDLPLWDLTTSLQPGNPRKETTRQVQSCQSTLSRVKPRVQMQCFVEVATSSDLSWNDKTVHVITRMVHQMPHLL